MNTTIKQQYRALAECVVEHYRGDIDIDLKIISAGNPAIFYLRSHGTHAVELHPFNHYPPAGETVPYLFARADRNHILEQCVQANKYHQDNPDVQMVVYFDGTTLKEIDKPRAQKIVDEYVRGMRDKFKRWNGLKEVG